LIYAPFAKRLTNTVHLIICPDGQLSRIPFEMLPLPPFGPQPRYWVEERTITYVTSGREVARLAQPSKLQKTNASIVLGNPDFNFNAAAEETPSPIVPQTNDSIDRLLLASGRTRTISRSYRGLSFDPCLALRRKLRASPRSSEAIPFFFGKEARKSRAQESCFPRVSSTWRRTDSFLPTRNSNARTRCPPSF